MKRPDLKSVLVAGMVGATLMIAYGFLMASPPPGSNSVTSAAATGFVTGAAVQIAVRLLGVS
jgi:hypothetical protein